MISLCFSDAVGQILSQAEQAWLAYPWGPRWEDCPGEVDSACCALIHPGV